MNVLGFKTVAIAKLSLPGDFKSRVEAERITERLESVERYGILSEPMVRKSDYRVIYGRDRVACCVRLGKTEVLVKLVECSDEEAYELELLENTQRRHDFDEQRLGFERLVDFHESRVRKEVSEGQTPAPSNIRGTGGRHKSPRGIARERVAKELGIKPSSVKRKEARVKAALSTEKLDGTDRKPKPQIELIGMEVEDEFSRQTEKIAALIGSCAGHLNNGLSSISQIDSGKLPFPAVILQKLYDEIRAVASLVRAHKPVTLCPFCKGLPSLQEACTACLGAGWLGQEKAKHVPAELWVPGDRSVVVYKGRYELVSALLGDLREGKQLDAVQEIETADEDMFA